MPVHRPLRRPSSAVRPPSSDFLRLVRFFAANPPNLFTTDYADIADKKSVSVLSVPSCKIRSPSVRLLLPLCPRSVGSVTKSVLRFFAPLALFCGQLFGSEKPHFTEFTESQTEFHRASRPRSARPT